MKTPIVLIGIGELGGEFARGLLRCGYPVYPITRGMDMAAECARIPEPGLVLITVQENELDHVLAILPEAWRDKVGLVQNELLPRHWQKHGISDPSVAVVWFEKKPGMALTNILYTPVYGPRAEMLVEALDAIKIPRRILGSEDALLFELLRKSLYIMTVNICGLAVGGSAGDLWKNHRALMRCVALESIGILEWLTGQALPAEKLIAGMVEGIDDCPDRNSVGRSAPARLERALRYAREAGLDTPCMQDIYRKTRDRE
ncbi:MAG: hypothetical protein ACU84J_06215 [Gammaproteobacteria bacterium]